MNSNIKYQTMKQMELVLNKLPGQKCMLVDPSLIRPLDRTVSMKFLSTLNVCKVYKIQKLPPEASLDRLVYVIPPNRRSLEVIVEHAEVDKQNRIKRTRLVVFVPKQTVAVQYLLESRGLLGGDLQTAGLSFGWIPLESDLFSLNLPELYTEYFLHGDTSWTYHFGQMLGQLLQEVLGPSESLEDINLYALGSAAQATAAGLKSFLLSSGKTPPPRPSKDDGEKRVVQRPLVLLFSRSESAVMRKMTKEERVEDLISAQVAILQSGSGGALAVPSGREGTVFGRQRPNDLDTMPPEAATGSCAEDPTCQPVRLALEWLSTNQGNKLTDAVRLLCLLSLTHDGLGEELYESVHLAIEHTVGFSVYPLLHALRRLKLLSSRKDFSTLPESNNKGSQLSLTQSSAEKLVASATGRLINRRKSTYNRLHRLFHLSLGSQACLTPDKPAVSPTYVFGGQHVPLVVRLAESLWASGLVNIRSSNDFTASTRTTNPLLTGPELLSRDELTQALSLLPIDKESAKTAGSIPLATKETATDAPSRPTTQCTSHGQHVLVVFVGGCTYAEVAALRFAAQRRCWHLLIATSQMLSSRSIIQQIGAAVV
nr:unnamed protein product [Spirometra erinaceieuropaei]